MKLLVTGATGYTGSHTVLALLEAGHAVVAVDNLCNSAREALTRVEGLTGQSVAFIEADIRDRDAMAQTDVRRIIFSSSATVYADPAIKPILETAPVGHPANPYGYSKLMIERLLQDLATSDPRWLLPMAG